MLDDRYENISMEALKQRIELESPDERNLYFTVHEKGCAARKLTLDDLYDQVKSIQLHSGVPEDIRSHFSQALNLAVYSWYHYPFNVTSQFMAFVTVELALKIKTGKRSNFRHLISLAVENEWISDEGFTIAKHREGGQEKRYVEILIEAMPDLRNRLAHGSTMLHNNCISSLLTCSEFINQLFEDNDS